jgi:hypothetical protein
MYVASVCFKCLIYSRRMLQLCLFGCCKIDLDVPCVTMASHVCCKFMFQIFHLFFKRTLQVFFLDVAKLALEVAKVHLLFKFPRARAKQSEWNRVCAWKGMGRTVPQGPRACNIASRVAHETKWGGTDLPRVRANGAKQGAASGRDVPGEGVPVQIWILLHVPYYPFF